MCGVIVVDLGSFWSTCLRRDAYIHDHCLGYHHDYLFFYQLPNSNLFTYRMLFSREKTPVKTMGPRSIFHHISFRSTLFCNLYFSIYIIKIPKIFMLCYHLYQISLFASGREGIDNPSYTLGCKYFVVCVQVLFT